MYNPNELHFGAVHARNVNDALLQGIYYMKTFGAARPSRAGPVLEIPVPVVTTYAHPLERVLFSPERDANPFFHFFEALWMLAGRNDVGFLTVFNKRMGDFSDDGETQNGAYGYRWRLWYGFDQLTELTALLRNDRDTRRAVLTMWSPVGDLLSPNGAAGGVVTSKDVPCNTQVFFKIRNGKLIMTVTNRSNDMLWGAYGANAVHMAFLLEYVANKVGVPAGTYHQISDSFHVYTTGPGGATWEKVLPTAPEHYHDLYTNGHPCAYVKGEVRPYPLGAETPDWDADLARFFSVFDRGQSPSGKNVPYKTAFFQKVVCPMWDTWVQRSGYTAMGIEAEDWRRAATEWLVRRAK